MTEKIKKLKTNQMMTVELPPFGNFQIGHKTEMGNVSQIVEMGNKIRVERGLKPKLLDHILNKVGFWEFVIARNTLFNKDSNSLKLRELVSSGKIDTLSESSVSDKKFEVAI